MHDQALPISALAIPWTVLDVRRTSPKTCQRCPAGTVRRLLISSPGLFSLLCGGDKPQSAQPGVGTSR